MNGGVAESPGQAPGEWVRRRTGIVPTPAPPGRHSERTAWDEGSRPTASEPPPEVLFVGRARAAGRHLIEVRDYYRAELAGG